VLAILPVSPSGPDGRPASSQGLHLSEWIGPLSCGAVKCVTAGLAAVQSTAAITRANVTLGLLLFNSTVRLGVRRNGATPLHTAAELGHVDASTILLEHGVDANAQAAQVQGLRYTPTPRCSIAGPRPRRRMMQTNCIVEFAIALNPSLSTSQSMGSHAGCQGYWVSL